MTATLRSQDVVSGVMRCVLPLVSSLLFAVGCSGGDDGPRPLERIDGPAELDPDFVNDGGADDRTDSGG